MTRTTTPAAVRLWTRVEKTPSCWNWLGCLDRKGYGIIGDTVGDQKISHRVHRLAYSLLVGPLADGVQVDHRCHNRRCVNPKHLRPTTSKQNQENRAGATRRSQTGVRGVFPCGRAPGMYEASINHNGQTRHAGRFASIAEAEAAVIALRLELFTHNDLDRVA